MTEKAKAKRNEQAEQHARSYDPAGFYKNLPPGIANTKDDFKAGFDAGYAERDKEQFDCCTAVANSVQREQQLVEAFKDLYKCKFGNELRWPGDSYHDFLEKHETTLNEVLESK